MINPIAVGGLTPFSMVDYPGHLAAVVFCQGCPWRCAYCHNPHLQAAKAPASQSWGEVCHWLESRSSLLDAVVFSGGEPLLQRGLASALWQVRQMGYRVALHTAGIYPERLAGVLPLVDWIGFDVKAAFCDYPRLTGGKSGARNGNAVQRALSFVLASGKPHEIRCTAAPRQLSTDDARRMAEHLDQLGVDRLVLQACRNEEGKTQPIPPPFVEAVKSRIKHVELRAA